MSKKTSELSAKATYSQNDSSATRVVGAHAARGRVAPAHHARGDGRDDAGDVKLLGEHEGAVRGHRRQRDLDHGIVDAPDDVRREEGDGSPDREAEPTTFTNSSALAAMPTPPSLVTDA